MFTPKLVFTFVFFYVCANFGENPSKMRVWECTQVDTRTEESWFYNLSHAVCYSYWTDNDICYIHIGNKYVRQSVT